ncbi:hypothetical protein [Rhizobium terrae]|uniref:hypothetical protein n=1 Tax=Rhizobium terrae TaxID=2171756 RepID=UPI000E3D0150|nr:hypothetical protein [Rhizobium terrae]
MSKQLPNTTLTANLLALVASEATTDGEHRARFDRLVARIKSALAAAQGPEVIHDRGLDSDFAEARLIAKDKLRMAPKEFESVVAVLTTPFSRVVNTCPGGKDPRNIPDFLKMPDDEMRFAYDLRTPYDAAFFIVRHGKTWGYSEAQILKAESELRPLDQARRKKIAEADARASAGYTATLYAADGTSRTYP